MNYRVTKTYGHELGLSACFRQWKAKSHCSKMHGYALSVTLVFECSEYDLDETNWVINFGGLKPVKAWLEQTFDHKTLVALDDPLFEKFQEMHNAGLIELVPVYRTGCEAFATMVFEYVENWLVENGHASRVKLVSAEVREHGANSAKYTLEGV